MRKVRRTDMTMFIVAFSNFANLPNKKETSMPSVGFERAIPKTDRPQTYALEGTATGIGE